MNTTSKMDRMKILEMERKHACEVNNELLFGFNGVTSVQRGEIVTGSIDIKGIELNVSFHINQDLECVISGSLQDDKMHSLFADVTQETMYEILLYMNQWLPCSGRFCLVSGEIQYREFIEHKSADPFLPTSFPFRAVKAFNNLMYAVKLTKCGACIRKMNLEEELLSENVWHI